MTDYLRSEEEQVAAIKQWWKDNGTSLVVGVAVALTGLFGWKAYQQNQIETREHRSIQFQQLLDATNQPAVPEADKAAEKVNNVAFLSEEILKDDKDSRYAIYARLMQAKTAVDESRYEDAEKTLRDALKVNTDAALKSVIQVRLARVLALRDQADEALKLLSEKPAEGFAAYFDEMKGDILKAQGKAKEAREAYESALANAQLTGGETRLLEIKIDDLAGA